VLPRQLRRGSAVRGRGELASRSQAQHPVPGHHGAGLRPYDVNTVRNRIRLLVEVTPEATFEADTTAKRVLYAAAGIPGYLVVHFDKDWARISEIEEYRLDWSSRRYVVQDVHRRALILDEPFRLTATFDDLQRP